MEILFYKTRLSQHNENNDQGEGIIPHINIFVWLKHGKIHNVKNSFDNAVSF